MKKIKLLFLTRYDEKGASSRIRFYNYKGLLNSSGCEVDISPLLTSEYLEKIYANARVSKIYLLKRYFLRFLFIISHFWKYDVLIFEKELFPSLPSFFDIGLLRLFKRKILDIDDAVYLNYENSSRLFKGKIEKLFKVSDIVFAGSPALEEKALHCGVKKVVWLPTPVPDAKFFDKDSVSDGLVVGWIGSPSTQKYLLARLELIKFLISEFKTKFVFIGAKSDEFAKVPGIEVVSWDKGVEEGWLKKFDLGIMPLNDSEWSRAKCSYKLLLYMSVGCPVIASPIGMNVDVLEGTRAGYLAGSDEEWVDAVKNYLNKSNDEKRSMRKRSYERVQGEFVYSQTFLKMWSNLAELTRSS